jgi:hypothetical protein
MSTRRYGKTKGKKSKTEKNNYIKGISGKKWTTAMDAAEGTLKVTGSLNAAKKSLRKQALFNARKLFGSI